MASSFAIKIGDEDLGPFRSEGEVTAALGEYRTNNPDDPEFTRVTVQELPEDGTEGQERSVWDFVEAEHEIAE